MKQILLYILITLTYQINIQSGGDEVYEQNESFIQECNKKFEKLKRSDKYKWFVYCLKQADEFHAITSLPLIMYTLLNPHNMNQEIAINVLSLAVPIGALAGCLHIYNENSLPLIIHEDNNQKKEFSFSNNLLKMSKDFRLNYYQTTIISQLSLFSIEKLHEKLGIPLDRNRLDRRIHAYRGMENFAYLSFCSLKQVNKSLQRRKKIKIKYSEMINAIEANQAENDLYHTNEEIEAAMERMKEMRSSLRKSYDYGLGAQPNNIANRIAKLILSAKKSSHSSWVSPWENDNTEQKNYLMPEIAKIRKMLKTTMTESPLKIESIQE
jgi:hypothetical protein